ncbi:hypothetical protein HALLA_00420 (plasmid) [Halostagnicola larsenii XH-48]|uniref:FAD/NAD(P)-binding domain-containing protein n=1 Tax=Halostagnicola larsenii XH-48 TaxID=797299 RepID=W0JWZ0_9EURY|nr:hypothetical protein HALLA_00420 [Halostagnicola larsenii XH-48]
MVVAVGSRPDTITHFAAGTVGFDPKLEGLRYSIDDVTTARITSSNWIGYRCRPQLGGDGNCVVSRVLGGRRHRSVADGRRARQMSG